MCLCQKEEISCGKDNTTYKSICQLRQANTELKHSGACTTPPTIVLSEEENMSLDEHERFALNCEAKAYPVPDIRWEFEGANGLFKTLPGNITLQQFIIEVSEYMFIAKLTDFLF